MIVAAAQSASLPGDIEANVAHHLEFAIRAAEASAELLIFPELSLIGYELSLARANAIRPDDPRLGPLRQIAVECRITVVAGAPLLGPTEVLHIGAVVFRPDGSVSTYTKEHVHSSEQHVFTSGPGAPPIRIGDANVGLAICADASHPRHAAIAAANGAHIYAVGVMITEEEYQRKAALMKQYATDHQMTVMMANYSGTTGGSVSAGRSTIWGPDGEIEAASAGAGEELIVASASRKHL